MKLFDIDYLLKSIPQLLECLPITLEVAVISFFISLIIALAIALIRIYKIKILQNICAIYVSFIRGTPVLVQLYLICYGIPRIIYYLQNQYNYFVNFNSSAINPIYYAIYAFSINLSAYLSETIRSSIEAIDIGQFEAAKAVGMTQKQLMIRIILPQALNVAIPNLGNTIISTIKDTSLVFMIGIVDVMGQAKIIGARGLAYFEVYIAVSLIYWITCVIIEKIISIIEKRMKRFERKIT